MHKKLLIPGPTEVSKEVLNAQTEYLIGHREKEFSTLYGGITDKITKYFQLPAEYKPTVTTGSGTLWFDIIGRSIVKEKALACVNGAFSQRAAQTFTSCGKQTDVLEVEMGKAIKPDMVAEKLATGKYDTLAVCHNETSTGVRNPIAEIGKMVKKEFPDVIFAVDAVSSMGGDKTLPQEMNCDIVFGFYTEMLRAPTRIGNRIGQRQSNRTRKNRSEQRRLYRLSRYL